ncbi:MAG TPA: dTMP kinase [Clostridiaceae bacterium]|nr:dTMP kinase [Clostridiaceae bacterium]
MGKGYFISIEGSDGSGKSTQIKLMKEYFASKGFEVVESREPGGTRIGEKVRNIILDNENVEMSPVTEALLYAASRAQHVTEVIRPCLKQGKVIICDRYIDSSIAYQGVGRGLGIDVVSKINSVAIQGIMPDLTVFFDIDPEVALNRKIEDGKADRLELEKLEFHKKVYKGYKQIASTNSRIKIIDASRSVMEIHKDVVNIIDEFLLKRSNGQSK